MKKNGYHIKNLRRFRITGMQKDNKKKIGKSTDWILCKLCFNIIALTTFQLSETISLKKTFQKQRNKSTWTKRSITF